MPGEGSDAFKKKVIPIIKHKGFKILSTLPTLMTYLQEQFPKEMEDTGLFPKEFAEDIIGYLEWYQNSLRPCVKQFVAFTVARYKCSNEMIKIPSERDLESDNDSKQEDQNISDEHGQVDPQA